MDETKTPMGARRLKQWIDRPLISKEQIEARLDIVDEFSAHFIERDTLRTYLNQGMILNVLLGVLVTEMLMRDLIQLKHSISEIPNIKALLNSMNQDTLYKLIN